MNETTSPLSWPNGWKRTPTGRREPARFASKQRKSERRSDGSYHEWRITQLLTVAEAIKRLQIEIDRLGGSRVVLSTNLDLRLDGLPRSGQSEPIDPGAAIYFTFKGKRTVLAVDKWTRVADNIAALAAHIECLRGIDRYGVGTLEQAFRGYQALEDFSNGTIPWRRVLGFKDDEPVIREQAEERYHEHMKRVHPDMTGEDHLQAAQLNLAIASARAELKEPA